MQDIARDLKISVVTVSKVLRNKGSISAGTRARVLERVKELNYQPNWIARSLVTRRTYTIGLLLPDFMHSFFAEIAKTVADEIRPQGYHVVISYFEEDPELERTEAEFLLSRQVDGVIVASSQSSSQAAFFEGIRKRDVPLVLIDRPVEGVNASYVGGNNHAMGELATEHLIELGCRRIAHLRGPHLGIAEGRLEGFRDALDRHGIPLPENFIVEAGYDDAAGYQAMKKMLEGSDIPDGIFCFNDPVAIGAMKAIFESGRKVPDDIAVVGAGNVHYSDALAVPLTTVDQGTREIGKVAAELLFEQISAKETPQTRTVLVQPKLVVRKSTQRSIPSRLKIVPSSAVS
ncbi:MAG TPA: LacI family DNA-binding transcriptional regulator [Candidatus Kapabacteria bacterium]|nr:LacI family DNA-binding transcriptional regulator [Candidatus Kapabacteria bacterium]